MLLAKLGDLLLRRRLTVQPILQSFHRLLQLPLRGGDVSLSVGGDVVDRGRRRFDGVLLFFFGLESVQHRKFLRDEFLITLKEAGIFQSWLLVRLAILKKFLGDVFALDVLNLGQLSSRVGFAFLIGGSGF